MKKVLVCGAGGFIGHHLVKYLKDKGYWVRGVDLKYPRFEETKADDFIKGDLRDINVVQRAIDRRFDRVYQLACYDKKTEVLTDSGFKYFKNLDKKDKIATLNEKEFLEYQKPTNIISYKYSGKMYNFKGKSVDFMVTPNHNMYVNRFHRDDYELKKAEDCDIVRLSFKTSAKWEGISKSKIYSKDICQNNNYYKNVDVKNDFDIKPFLRFLGYYLAEGSCLEKENSNYVIRIANKNEDIISDVYNTIKDLGFNAYIERNTFTGVSFQSVQMYTFLKQFGFAGNKFIPKYIKNLSPNLLKIIFESMMKGDGSTRGREYYTTSKILADDVQEILLKMNYSSTIYKRTHENKNWNTKYVVSFSKRGKRGIVNKPNKVEYNGYVYCVEVPNHIIFVRRNGKTGWCGNCDMGGAGFVFTKENDADIMHNSALINLNVLDESYKRRVKKIFYSSSACIYPEYKQEKTDIKGLKESSAYPAEPDSEYGWEKLFSEHLYNSYYRNKEMNIRIARFHNIMGELGSWNDGREKAPAALCRKIALAKDGDTIEVWGDGEQTRSFLYIDECLEGIERLMNSDYKKPINIGSDEKVSINGLVEMIANIANKNINVRHDLSKPQGVRGRNSDNELIQEVLNWQPDYPLKKGLVRLYPWIETQVKKNLKIETSSTNKSTLADAHMRDHLGLDKKGLK